MRKFNVTGLCLAHKHYMVDISGKLKQIMEMIDDGSYFTINRARQYGKTTTLSLLRRTLPCEYTAVSISFEGLGNESFASPEAFCLVFMELVQEALEFANVSDEYKESWLDSQVATFKALGGHITKMCKGKKLVLMIDEVDKTSNNQVFLHFLGMLRSKYLRSEDGMDSTFHSVILAGVYNSPWNIAADFEVDMSFGPAEIATMLSQYEADHGTGMDIPVKRTKQTSQRRPAARRC